MRMTPGIVAEEVVGFFVLWCVTQTRIAGFVRTGYIAAGAGVEMRRTQLPTMYGIMGVSAACALTVSALNHRYHCRAEEHLFAILSPPFLFYMQDLFSDVHALSMERFIGLTVLSWVLSYCFSYRDLPAIQRQPSIESTDTEDSIVSLLPTYPDASRKELLLNAGRIGQAALFSIAAFCELIVREWFRETEEPFYWMYEGMAVCVVAGAALGYRLHKEPVVTRGYLKFPIEFFETFALVYTAMSAWFVLFSSADNVEKYKMVYTHICAYVSLAASTFSALRAEFDFADNHEKNLRLFSAPARIREKCHAAAEYCDEKRRDALEACGDFGNTLSRARDSFVNSLPRFRNFCRPEEEAPLMSPV